MFCIQNLFFLISLQLCRGGSVTGLVKRLIREGSYLSEDLIAFIIHETLKVVIQYISKRRAIYFFT